MGASQPLAVEPGAVSVVNPSNAKSEIWAHEYRHGQGLGRDEERLNRKIDAWNAQNKAQWDDALAWAKAKGLIDADVSYEDSVTGAYLP